MRKLVQHLANIMRLLFPAYTWRGRLLLRLVPDSLTAGVGRAYRNFIATAEPNLWHPVVSDYQGTDPLVTVLVPMFNTPDAYLRPLLDSLCNQTFTHFEVIIADASTDTLRAAAIESASKVDPRFHYVRLATNAGISDNTNAALAHATAPYVAFVDHDDTLSLHAMNEVATVLIADPDIDIVYSDEDVLSENGLDRRNPFIKPVWSPHMFLECNYTNHLSVIRRSLVEAVGGLHSDFDGAQDYDLLLRLHTMTRPPKVCHIPAVLYHWRQTATSTARKITTKNYAVDAGRTALTEYLHRVGVACDGVDDAPEQPGWYRIKPRWDASVTVVCSGPAAAHVDTLRKATKPSACHPNWLSQPGEFDASVLDKSDAVVLVSQLYLPDDPSWLDDLVGVLTLPRATVVAPLLAGPEGRVDSAGFAWDGAGVLNILHGNHLSKGNMCGPTHMVRDVDAISRAVVAAKWDDLELLSHNPDLPTLVVVPAGRGHAVVWAHQCMTRREGLRRDGYVNMHIDVGGMGWVAPR